MMFLAAMVILALIVVWLTKATYDASDSVGGCVLGAIGGIVLPLVFYSALYIAIDEGRAANLKTGVAYEVSGAYEGVAKDTASTVVLELRTPSTASTHRYFYLVSCSSLRDGCPEKWPVMFKAVQDGQKLVVVPLTETKSGS